MVPAHLVKLDTFPLTPNGKVDRKALPAPDLDGAGGSTYVAPRSVTEELLAGIWADILGLERVGVRDHFFELGGHSLLATQVVSRIRSAFQIELPLRAAFECPTVADLAATVDRVRAEGNGRQVPALTAGRREGPAPLSFAQQRLWFLAQLEPESWLYNLSFGLRLRGPLDVDALRRSFEAPGVSWDPYVADLAADEARRPFALEGSLLWRVKLVQLSEQDHLLLVTLHHAIADGWSLNLLLSDMVAAYGALRADQPVPLMTSTLQYADYAQWQCGWSPDRTTVHLWRRA